MPVKGKHLYNWLIYNVELTNEKEPAEATVNLIGQSVCRYGIWVISSDSTL